MEQRVTGQAHKIVITMPGGSSGDTYTYDILVTNGDTFATGTPTYIGGSDVAGKEIAHLLVTLTPVTVGEVYTIQIYNATTDSWQTEKIEGSAPTQATTTVSASVPTSQEMLNAIDVAIYDIINNGGVRQYMTGELGQNLSHYSLEELKSLRQYYVNMVSTSKNSQDLQTVVEFRKAL